MTGKTSIEWTHMPDFEGDVWNPTTGCTRVSDGCDNCYAFALHDKRYVANRKVAQAFFVTNDPPQNPEAIRIALPPGVARSRGAALPWPRQYDLPFSRVQLLEDRLDAPLRKRKPTCYFVDSMADLFHEDVPPLFIARTFNVMGNASQHRFLILTKRPERMAELVAFYYRQTGQEPFPNVWLGTSVEDQRAADERIPHLLATPAAVRFLSCEPLLGQVDLTKWIGSGGVLRVGHPFTDAQIDDIRAKWDAAASVMVLPQGTTIECLHTIDWVIVGGESGLRARPMDLAWARSLRDQCAAAGVSFFMKQLGSKPYHIEDLGYTVREAHGRNPDEWPEDLRVRTWPR